MFRYQPKNAALTLVETLVVIAIIGILFAISLPLLQLVRSRSKAMVCQSRLRQLGHAIHLYEEAIGVLPFGVGADRDNKMASYYAADSRRFSVHALLLPYLEQTNVYDAINFLDTPFPSGVYLTESKWWGTGANETVACTRIQAFLCPVDTDRMMLIPWGKNNYRSCNGNSWDGRGGNGLFAQNSSVRLSDVTAGLDQVAAFSERIRGDNHKFDIDRRADLFRVSFHATKEQFMELCRQFQTSNDAALYGIYQDALGGQTWLEGNMNWTRYNHCFPPEHISCKNRVTWEGVSMSASSYHHESVHVLFGSGKVQAVNNDIDATVWRTMGTIHH